MILKSGVNSPDDQLADVDEVNLAPVASVRRVEDDHLPVMAGAGMRVAAPLIVVFRR